MPVRACALLLASAAQVEPASSEPSITAVPPVTAPVAKHSFDVQATAFNAAVVPLVRALHVAPASEVPMIVPDAPAATQLLADEQATPLSALAVPLVAAAQLAPPSAETRTTPPAPAAMHVAALGQATPLSAVVVSAEVRESHVWPPSVVRK